MRLTPSTARDLAVADGDVVEAELGHDVSTRDRRSSSAGSGSGSPACQQATRPVAVGDQRRVLGPAVRVGERAAGGVRAAGRYVGRVDRAAGDGGERRVEVGRPCRGPRPPARACRGAARAVDSSAAGQLLDDPAGVHHQHPVADLADHGDVVADQHQGDVVGLADRGQQVEHLLLDRDVEGGRGLVGDDQRGRAHQPHPDHGPLPHAAGELVRVAGAPARRRRRSAPRRAGRRRGPSPRRRFIPRWAVPTSASWPPIRRVGLNEVIGSWKTMASEVPSIRRSAGVSLARQVVAEQLQPGRGDRAVLVDQPGDRERGQRLARAGLPHDAEGLAAAYGERDAADRPHRPVQPGEGDARSRTSSTRSGSRVPASVDGRRHGSRAVHRAPAGAAAAGSRRSRRRRGPWRPTRRTG